MTLEEFNTKYPERLQKIFLEINRLVQTGTEKDHNKAQSLADTLTDEEQTKLLQFDEDVESYKKAAYTLINALEKRSDAILNQHARVAAQKFDGFNTNSSFEPAPKKRNKRCTIS